MMTGFSYSAEAASAMNGVLFKKLQRMKPTPRVDGTVDHASPFLHGQLYEMTRRRAHPDRMNGYTARWCVCPS